MDNRTLVTLLIAGSLCVLVLLRPRTREPFPPGPPREPLIGHLRIMPQEKQAEVFHEWAKTYGDVMYLEIPGRRIVVLDSLDVSRALLEDKGAKYSGRPWFVIWDIMGWSHVLTFLSHGKQFLKHRKLIQTFFGRSESLAYNTILAQEARLLIKNLAAPESGDLSNYVHRLTVSIIMRVAYGHQVKSDDDVFLKIGNDFTFILNNAGQIGNTPVDLLPWLRHLPSWFPGTHYATLARGWYKRVQEMRDDAFEFVQNRMEEETAEKSFVSDKLEGLDHSADLKSDEDGLTLDDIKGAALTIFAAGQETTYTTLKAFVLAMMHHPEIQKRAYEEITSVVGQDRLPDLNDRGSLPYLECTYSNASVASVPHRSLQDDVFNGMFIPKGTIVYPNIRSMSRDERVYSDPLKFNPSRYLPSPEGRSEPQFPAMWGFGRRYFADLAIWHAIACILATLEILPPKDERGNDVLPEPVVVDGLTSGFAPFDFGVRIRSEQARALIADIE
ncbi:cytochrome P450 [Marasmius fiardii PR-910]|nr:cytochrome P450 [Marasmius fiardii PR-910]